MKNSEITDEYEDIHTFMEAALIERIGDAGKRLHTGRSRNDQVALDIRSFIQEYPISLYESGNSFLRSCILPDVLQNHPYHQVIFQ